MAIVGVDACSTGWIAVVLRDESVEAIHFKRIDELGAAVPDAEVIAIDIPIGLPATVTRIMETPQSRSPKFPTP